MLGIGIDTGGTCTDAVLYDYGTETILAEGKAPTTKQDLKIGIANALDQLPAELVKQAQVVSLSTTLATNACIENKGARAKLLMLGFDESMILQLKDIYAGYGLKDLSLLTVMDAKAEGVYAHPFDPDWQLLSENAKTWFSDCACVGIVQKHPRANGGRFEREALKILKSRLSVPVTTSHEISNETDILKTCAGTMLNARLIPLIDEFIRSVHQVLKARSLSVPICIMRSDGTEMTEGMAAQYPVETILSGPSASVVGGSALAGEPDALVVDMGGTTTDIAIVLDAEPLSASNGIQIGQWKTMVRGLKVDTCALGGDTAVRCEGGKLSLDTVRVMPLCVLSSMHDDVITQLQALKNEKRYYFGQPHEFFVLLRDISGQNGFTAQEKEICAALKDGPLIAPALGRRLGLDLRFIDTRRLEEEGIIIKSGLTPTDMMVLKGDFTLYDPAASREALEILSAQAGADTEKIPDLVYEMVYHRLYCLLGKVLLRSQWSGRKIRLTKESADLILECCYRQAKEQFKEEKEQTRLGTEYPHTKPEVSRLMLSTKLPLVGVGAPIHLFLPRVAALFRTKAVIPSHAHVANALGAAAARKRTRFDVTAKAIYEGFEFKGFAVFDEENRQMFEQPEEAEAFARKIAVKKALRWGQMQALDHEPRISLSAEENRFGHTADGLLFEIVVHASVME